MIHTVFIVDPRQWRRELAQRWAGIRAGLRACKGHYEASAVLRRELRKIEETYKTLKKP